MLVDQPVAVSRPVDALAPKDRMPKCSGSTARDSVRRDLVDLVELRNGVAAHPPQC